MKKKYKMIGILVVLIFAIILVKNNIYINAEPISKDNYALALDINSELIKSLYQRLNLDLINSTCKEPCIPNNSYNYTYYLNHTDESSLTNQEVLYLAINSIYKKGTYTKEKIDDETHKIIIEDDVIVGEVFNEFNIADFKGTIDNSNCGIKDFLYTGEKYELTISECPKPTTYALSKLASAKKEENYIHIYVKAFKVTEHENQYSITNFDSDKEIDTVKSKKDFDKIFKKKNCETFEFTFELLGETYFLKTISKV